MAFPGAVLVSSDIPLTRVQAVFDYLAATSLGVYNVKEYGATGNGTTDDTAAIQAAVTACPVGGIVYIPSGTYKISATINVSKRLTIMGQGWDTILALANASNCYAFTFAPSAGQSIFGAQFRDFRINCNGANQSNATGGGIYAFSAVQCHFERLYIDLPVGNGVFCYQDGNGGTGHHNRFYGCLFTNGANQSVGDGRAIRFEGSDENMVVSCDFETNGRGGATEPNHIYDRSGLNLVHGCVFVGGATGIKCEGSQTTITGCIFDGIAQHNVRFNGDRHSLTGCQFFNIGNGATGATWDGVWVDNVPNITITGNVFYSAGDGTRSGVNFANGATNGLLTGNRFVAQGLGFRTASVLPGTGNLIAHNAGFKTEAGGISTQTPGAVTTVTIAHGLAAAPTAFSVQPNTTNARGAPAYFVTADATNLTLTFASALTAATAYAWAWQASVL